MQHSSWHDLVEAVWPEKKDTVDFLRDEKRRTEVVSAANSQTYSANGSRRYVAHRQAAGTLR